MNLFRFSSNGSNWKWQQDLENRTNLGIINKKKGKTAYNIASLEHTTA